MDTRQVSMEELVVLAEARGARGGDALTASAKSWSGGEGMLAVLFSSERSQALAVGILHWHHSGC